MRKLVLAALMMLLPCTVQATDISHQTLITDPLLSTDKFPIGRPNDGYPDGRGPARVGNIGMIMNYVNDNFEALHSEGTCSTSKVLDIDTYKQFTMALNGTCAISVSGLASTKSFIIYLTQNGSTAPTFSSEFKWAGGVTPSFSTSAGMYDTVACASPDGAKLICSAVIDAR